MRVFKTRVAALLAALPISFCAIAQDNTSEGLGGPVVPGVCLLSREAIVAQTKVGKDVAEKLKKLAADAQAEIDREQSQLDAELERLGLRKPGLQESQLTEPQRAGLKKAQALQQKARERSAQMEAARTKALKQISEAAQPEIAKIYTKRKCGLLFSRTDVLGGNMSNDLTREVVEALDAKVATLAVKLEPVPSKP